MPNIDGGAAALAGAAPMPSSSVEWAQPTDAPAMGEPPVVAGAAKAAVATSRSTAISDEVFMVDAEESRRGGMGGDRR